MYHPTLWKQYRLRKILREQKRIAIITGRNPSPDDLASALILKRIADHYNMDAKILYTGSIYNKTLANIMENEIEMLPESFDGNYTKFALINTLPGSSNNGHIREVVGDSVSIIIGHSIPNPNNIKCEFKDIRKDINNTTSIMTGYLENMKIPLDKNLATILFYALREKTNMFVENVTETDFKAYSFIQKHIDTDLLTRFEKPSVKSETFTDLVCAIKRRMIKDTHLFTSIGHVKDTSTLQKVCRYMLDLEGVTTALITAVNNTRIYLYAESGDPHINIKNMLSQIIKDGEIIAESNHGTAIAPLGIFGAINDEEGNKILIKSIEEILSERYFTTLVTS
ncbi:hypothetical protein B6U67_05770 [Methanosarcinales archaeon ex4484_138]|nr:MAG: hypothetical protein B6U67_05770 [Methanosarcinales archaeon ex4484_138]